MLRKILMGAAVLATSSFATFSNFPVPAAQSGEVKIVSDFTMQGDWKDLGLSAKGRFVPVQNLELYLKLPFTVVTRWEGHDADKEGMKNLTFGGRYQIISTVAAFLDVTFPTGKDAINDDGFSFYFGGQYSKDFGAVALGSEVGLTVITEGSNHKPADFPKGDRFAPRSSHPTVGLDVKPVRKLVAGTKDHYIYELPDDYLAATCDGNTKTPITLSASFNASFK